MSNDNLPPFGRMRSILWPIYQNECKKILSMSAILFLICFNYSIIRNLKDTVVVTAKNSGAEVIPFIKVWALLPMAILLTYIFTKLANRYKQTQVFYTIISGFLLFFAVFGYVLYPYQDWIHPTAWANRAMLVVPQGLKGLITMVSYWSFTLFYVMAELWGSIVLCVLFWSFANSITTVKESRRFYGFLGIGSNLAAISAGVIGNSFTKGLTWNSSVLTLLNLILFNGVLAMGFFWYLTARVLKKEQDEQSAGELSNQVNKKQKLGIRESFRYLLNSKYLICIAVLVISYNLVINLVEVVWKAQLRELHPLPEDYNSYMNTLTTWVGIISSVTALFLARLIGRFGWTTIALTTPILTLTTSIGFFAFFFFRQELGPLTLSLLGCTPLAITVFFGGAQVCLSKAAKYSVFDTTKEMAFIPLDAESKLRGKAAIDGVGSRLGKSGGSMIHQTLFLLFGSINSCTGYLALILFLVIGIWMVAAKTLGAEYQKLTEELPEPAITPQEVTA